MRTNKWYPAIAGGQPIAVKFIVLTEMINTVRVSISIPCRKGQYVILYGVDNSKYTFEYYDGKCIISYRQNTSGVRHLEDLFEDIRIWFRCSYAVRLNEGDYTYKELITAY